MVTVFSHCDFVFKNRNYRSVGEELKEEIQKSSPIPTYGFLATSMFLTSESPDRLDSPSKTGWV